MSVSTPTSIGPEAAQTLSNRAIMLTSRLEAVYAAVESIFHKLHGYTDNHELAKATNGTAAANTLPPVPVAESVAHAHTLLNSIHSTLDAIESKL
jgi:hypothetical protein